MSAGNSVAGGCEPCGKERFPKKSVFVQTPVRTGQGVDQLKGGEENSDDLMSSSLEGDEYVVVVSWELGDGVQWEAELGSPCFLGADSAESPGLATVFSFIWDQPAVSDPWLVSEFPVAAVTSDHKLSGFQ